MSDPPSPPEVAVIVPVYNRLALLKTTVSCLRAQTLREAEFILVDDRSEAGVQDYLRGLPAEDARFRVLRKPDGLAQGCQTSKNVALDLCLAPLVVFLDSDDLMSPDCLSERAAIMRQNPQIDLLAGRQAVFDEASGMLHWVNQPLPGVPDLDRFLDLVHPLDVPWVNGGSMLRLSRLNEAGIRWRAGYAWEDVAFHFDCLSSGFRVLWLDRDGPPDTFYRLHGTTMGSALHTPSGIQNAARMFLWMQGRLAETNAWTPPRRAKLARSFFHACVLRAVDLGEDGVARQVAAEAAGSGLFTSAEARRVRIYLGGRRRCRSLPRLTYYWNRLARRFYLRPFFEEQSSSYGSVPPAHPDSAGMLRRLLSGNPASSVS